MRILFDFQIFHHQKIGGISRYFVEVLHELNKLKNVNAQIACSFSSNLYLKSKGFSVSKKRLTDTPYEIINLNVDKALHFLNKKKANALINASNYDVFHPTYYNNYFLKSLRKPFVITVYDMIHEKFPKYYKGNPRDSVEKKVLCQKATKIIAISENTKKDLVKLFKIPADKIEVVYLSGGFANNSLDNTSKIKLPNKYILFVGSRSLYKNFATFLNSITPLLQKDNELFLVCTGIPFTQKEKEIFQKNDIEKKVLHFFPSDNELKCLYQKATLFVFPSLYEGFGIPVLEAFSANCPAILSNTSSLPEVGGNAAEYFDPYSEDSIRYTIEKVLYNEPKQKELSKKGKERLQNFSWERTAKKTLKIYESVV